MLRSFRKPLIIFTPKSLLRHKLAVSKAEDFLGEKHFMRILSDLNPAPDEQTKRLVLCTGKVAYDLIEARDAAGDKSTQIVRIEQLYPFRPTRWPCASGACPGSRKWSGARRSPATWAPGSSRRTLYRGRAEGGRQSTDACALCRAQGRRLARHGLAKRHLAEQGALIADALGHSVRAEIKRQKKG